MVPTLETCWAAVASVPAIHIALGLKGVRQPCASDPGCCFLLRSSQCQASAHCCQAVVSSLTGKGGTTPQLLLCPATAEANLLGREGEAPALSGSSTWLSEAGQPAKSPPDGPQPAFLPGWEANPSQPDIILYFAFSSLGVFQAAREPMVDSKKRERRVE
jgi:hypothetical protein